MIREHQKAEENTHEHKEQVEQARKLLAYLQSRTTAMAEAFIATRSANTFVRSSWRGNANFFFGAAR